MEGKAGAKIQNLSHHPPKSPMTTERGEKVWHLDHEIPRKGWCRFYRVCDIRGSLALAAARRYQRDDGRKLWWELLSGGLSLRGGREGRVHSPSLLLLC